MFSQPIDFYVFYVFCDFVSILFISKTDMKRIEAFKMWIWRKMEKISWTAKVSNSEVLN